MFLAVKAWKLRESARQALRAGDFQRAFEQAQEAQAVQAAPMGEFLRALCAWLLNSADDRGLSSATHGPREPVIQKPRWP